MAPNLIDSMGTYLTPATMDRLADAIGETPASTSRAAGVAIPALLAGIVRQGSTEAGAARLLEAMRDGGYDESTVGRTAPLLDDDAGRRILVERGRSLLAALFGSKADAVIEAVSVASAIGRNATARLLAMIGPFVLAAFGQRVKDEALDARAVSSLLERQRAPLVGVLPAPITRILGWGPAVTAAEVTGPAVATARTNPGMPPARHRAAPAWLWPVVGIAALVGGAWAVSRAAREPSVGTTRITSSATPNGLVQMTSYLAESPHSDRTFAIDGIAFDSASSAVLPTSRGVVDRLAQALQAHPNARVRIEGHTDDDGDPASNRTLSERRAAAVRDELVRRGVAPDRIETAGYGPDRPIAPNSTDEGRARNRRIEVVVLGR